LSLDTVLFDPEAYYREVRDAWRGTDAAVEKQVDDVPAPALTLE